MTNPVYLQAMGALSALGGDAAAMRAALFASQYPETLTQTDSYSNGRTLTLGCLPESTSLVSVHHAPPHYQSRNNALALTALHQIRRPVEQAIAMYGPARVAVVVGTSTSGVSEGEDAAMCLLQEGGFPKDFNYALQEVGNVAEFLALELGVAGPAHVISTACSSGAKAIAAGARMIRAGLVDAVVAGGVDALCGFTIAGFSALESVSEARSNPSSANRCGINLGEGAALFLMGRQSGPVRLIGWGESQDAHHMSAPDPQGRGAIAAMAQALDCAGLSRGDVDYVNLHGTATVHNDAMEHLAVNSVLGDQVWASSTKPMTGHALAAAGAIEAAIAWHVLCDNGQGILPPHWWDGVADTALASIRLVEPGSSIGHAVRHVMSNSFAFGGSNVALLFAAC